MSWVAVGVTAVGAVGSYVAGRQRAPQAATPTPVNVQEEQRRAITGNLANFDDAATLARRTNNVNQSEATRLLEQAIPGFGALQKRLLDSVNTDLDGSTSLPPELQQKVAQFAAERGITRGTSGNFNAFNLVRDFGFNLIDWRNASRARALNTLSTVYGMAPRVNVMSPMASMVDPNTAIQVAGNNNTQRYNADQAANNANAAATNYQNSQLAGLISGLAGTFAGGIREQRAARAANAPAPINV